MASTFRPSPLGLAILSLLVVGPLHPYGIQRLIQHWGKDQVVNVGRRANLYKTINRLRDAGLIAVRQTERSQQYPERTVYQLTAKGREETPHWLAEMLANPVNEFPQFPAALSFMMLLTPDRALALLEQRAAALREKLTGLEHGLAKYSDALPRVTLLDDEYRRAVSAAELAWVDGVIDDIRAGTLSWSKESLASLATEELADQASSILPK